MKESHNNIFFSEFCGIYAKQGMNENNLKKMRDVLKNVVNKSLFDLESERLCITRHIGKTKKLNLDITNNFISVSKIKNKKLLVSVIAPSWRHILGKKRAKSDDIIYEIIKDFFWLLNQYIYRSRQVNLTVGLTLEYGKFFDFKGNNFSYRKIYEKELFTFNTKTNNNKCSYYRKIKSIKKYLEIINCLEPQVHIACFHFMKAVQLKNKLFYAESITHLSCILEAIGNFIKKSKFCAAKNKDLVSHICSVLEVSKRTMGIMQYISELRCKMTAHSALAYWWDFDEIHEEDIDMLFHHSSIVLRKFFQYEFCNRRVQANPTNWAEWFSDNSDLMMDIVWNDSYPSLPKI